MQGSVRKRGTTWSYRIDLGNVFILKVRFLRIKRGDFDTHFLGKHAYTSIFSAFPQSV